MRRALGRRVAPFESGRDGRAPRLGRSRSSHARDLGYVLAWMVWASIVRLSAPSVIGTLRGFADSATGMRSVSTPFS